MTKAQDAHLSGIEWIDQHPCLLALSSALALKEAQEDLEDNLIFEELESEMMKRGTLAHQSIRWDFVIEQATLLLREGIRDWRLMVFILHSLGHVFPTPSLPSALPLAVQLAYVFVAKWGKDASPQEHTRGRARSLTHMVEALDILLKKAEENGLEAHYHPCVTTRLQEMATLLAGETAEQAARLREMGKRASEIAQSASDISSTSPSPSHESAVDSPQSAANKQTPAAPRPAPAQLAPPASSELVLDSTNERSFKEGLAKMADFLFDLDSHAPLSYRLRRYACWYGMREQPALKSGEATIILPPSEESVELYTKAVEEGAAQTDPDPTIAKRLERSCYLHPFWIEGHYLAWKLARASGRTAPARAILEEAYHYTQAAPWLYKLQFASTAPFITPAVRQWLEAYNRMDTAQATNHAAGSHQDGLTNQLQQAQELAKLGDMAQALTLLDTQLAQAATLRMRTMWEVAIIEWLGEWGMKHHAQTTANRLEEMMQTTSAAIWDGELMQQIQQLKSATPSI